jgi:hypothetical protein
VNKEGPVHKAPSEKRGSFVKRLSAWTEGIMGSSSATADDEAKAIASSGISASVPPVTPEAPKLPTSPAGDGSHKSTSVRDIFSPTRESHSPSAPTPPPVSFVVPESNQKVDGDEDEVGEMKHLSQHQK